VLNGGEPAVLPVGDQRDLGGPGRGGQGEELAVRAFGTADGQAGKMQVQEQNQVGVGVVERSRVKAGGAVVSSSASAAAIGRSSSSASQPHWPAPLHS